MYTILSAVCFSGWNMIARKAGVNQYWMTIIVCIGTLIPVMMQGVPKIVGGSITMQAVAILLIAGLVNGIGFVFYGQAVDGGAVSLSVLLTILFGAMVLFSYFGGVWFFNDTTSTSKYFGVGFMVLGIYLMNQ